MKKSEHFLQLSQIVLMNCILKLGIFVEWLRQELRQPQMLRYAIRVLNLDNMNAYLICTSLFSWTCGCCIAQKASKKVKTFFFFFNIYQPLIKQTICIIKKCYSTAQCVRRPHQLSLTVVPLSSFELCHFGQESVVFFF